MGLYACAWHQILVNERHSVPYLHNHEAALGPLGRSDGDDNGLVVGSFMSAMESGFNEGAREGIQRSSVNHNLSINPSLP